MSLLPIPIALYAPATGAPDAPPAGPTIWLRASSYALSDGSTITGAWPDSSGGGATVTPGGSPVYRAADINGLPAVDYGGAGYFLGPSTGLPGGSYTLFGVGQAATFNDSGQLVGGYATALRTTADRYARLYHQGAGFNGAAWQVAANTPHSICATFRAATLTARLYVNGRYDLSSVRGGVITDRRLVAGAFNPGGGGSTSNGRQSELLIYDRELSGDELSQLHVWANARYGFSATSQRVVAFEGGSWTYGYGVDGGGTLGGDTYQRYALDQIDEDVTGHNAGVSGHTVLTMIADAPTLNRAYDAAARANVLVFWGGSNDLDLGADAATAYARIVSYCQEARAVGWRVLMLPTIDRAAELTDQAVYDARRLALNDLVRAGWPTFADALVDLTTDPRFGPPGARLDPAYYQADLIHLTVASNAIIGGDYVAPTLRTLLAA